ncbi:pyocin knob domain-containing protein [Acetatifactor muris]|uniref:pyocin knob domain-containing protein n=1 Tax=Acetatifactor muris TaxID=879566 RepID=UPI000CD06A32|nr:pyocin knob domain-containing protein [Acetatifactor muris]MCR2050377.1 pyocin knob domain-containing protein [Acetatifactor muris]
MGTFKNFTKYDIAKYPSLASAPTGFYAITSENANKLPDAPPIITRGGRLYVIKSNVSDEEFILVICPADRKIWINYLYNITWSGWEDFAVGGRQRFIPANADANTLLTPGIYSFYSANVQSSTNFAFRQACVFEVINSGSYILQRQTSYMQSWIRFRDAEGKWYDWYKISN